MVAVSKSACALLGADLSPLKFDSLNVAVTEKTEFYIFFRIAVGLQLEVLGEPHVCQVGLILDIRNVESSENL